MKNYIFLSTIIVCALFAQPQLPPEHHEYTIQSGDKTIGWFGYELAPVPNGWRFSGETFMAVVLNDKPSRVRYKTAWELDTYMVPKNYSLEIIFGDKENKKINAQIIGDSISFVSAEAKQKLPFNKGGFIIEMNLLDGWVLLSKLVDPSIDEVTNTNAFVPQLGKMLPLKISPGAIESESGGKVRHFFVDIAGMKIEFFSQLSTRQVVQWSFPMQGLKMILSDGIDKKSIEETAVGVDILKDMFKNISPPTQLLSDMQIGSPLRLKTLIGNIKLRFERGTNVVLKNETQDFQGTFENGFASGKVTIHARTYNGKGAMSFPVGPIPEPSKGTLESDEAVESHNDAIILKATELSKNCKDIWCVAKRINRFVADSIRPSDKDLTASGVLSARTGNPYSRSCLCCALLRAIGIPARIVGGFILDDNMWVKHNWVAIWPGKDVGWIQIDPSTGEDETFSASHILLWEGAGNLEPSGENSINIISAESD